MARYPPPVAILIMFTFCSLFFVSVFLWPASIFLCLFQSNYTLFLILIIYYSYRAIFPAEYWPEFHQIVSKIISSYDYCEEKLLIQEGYEEANKIVLPPSKTLLCWHPHGILCLGWGLNGIFNPKLINCNNVSSKNNHWRWLGIDPMFRLPFYSDFIKWCGADRCSKHYFESYMKDEENFCLLPGGIDEQELFQYGKHQIAINSHMGFIKYALKYGYTLYPVYSFGEEYTYHAFNYKCALNLTSKKYSFPLVLASGWFKTHLPIPYVKLISVIGKPLNLPQINEPTYKDIQYWHSAYVKELVQLFDKYKVKYGNCSAKDQLIVS